ncbi:hypothetical protein CEXT_250711 [Caerostris extrusa]|uniref:Uncharacterized protein n=1 Tax=Caerostris extrusa TaxID=172846 RepID=A0AAV4SV44_CAEEX|nr:hypothetical protein CEXT_250711 [Caerostris extrusa]
MIDMEVPMEGNGPSQVYQQVPSSPGSDVNAIQVNDSTKMTPQGLCRRLVSAHQEMEVIDEILLLNVQLVRYPLIMIKLIALKTLKNLIESIRLRQTLSPVMLKMSKLLLKNMLL